MIDPNNLPLIGLIKSWLDFSYFGIQLWQYILSFFILLGSFVVKKLVETILIRWIITITSKTSFKYDTPIVQAIAKPIQSFIIIGGIHLAILTLIANKDFSWEAVHLLKTSYLIAVGVLVIWFLYRVVDILTIYLEELTTKKHKSFKPFIPLIKKSLRIFVILLGALTILSTLEVNISSLLAGFGIGGIAIGLAAKDSLSNFFGSLSLLIDRPFNVGDWIIVGDKINGDVESIGFRSTTIRTWPKTLISIPNSVLANEVIDNWARMPKRRVKQTLGITYDTGPDKLEKILEEMRLIVQKDEGVHQEFILVQFLDFGPSSLDILVYYFTKPKAWKEYLHIRERINLKLMRCITENGGSIAFPTQTLHIEGYNKKDLQNFEPNIKN